MAHSREDTVKIIIFQNFLSWIIGLVCWLVSWLVLDLGECV